MAKHNVISFEQNAGAAKQRLLEERHRRAVAGMRAYLEQTLPPLIHDLLDRLDDEFYELADKSANDLLQTRYFEAMRALRKHRNAIQRDFVDGRLAAFDRFWRESAPHPVSEQGETVDLGEEDMALVDKDDLEEDLAVSTLISKAENRYYRTLFNLHKRFAAIHGVESFDESANPVGPSALGRGFAEALRQWDSDTEVRLIVYKLFDRHVMAYMGGVYDELNDILVANDILPRIERPVRRNPVAPAVQRARGEEGRSAPAGADGLPLEPAMLDALAQLMARRRSEDANLQAAAWYARADAASGLPQIDSSDLLGALGEVQRASLSAAPADLAGLRELQAELMLSLGRELEVGSPERPMKRLSEGDRSMLDVMELLFDFILGDENLPEPMKALLGRLQIPMLKVGLMDRRFFSDSGHPARRLLNNLARAAFAWNDDGDRSATSPYGRIETAVTRILSDFTDDIALFEKVNAEFEDWLKREQRNAQVAEKKLAQAREGQEHLHQARQRVDVEVASLLQGRPLPEPVVELLDKGWRDVLLLTLLRQGEHSEDWRDALALARQLVWSVQPKCEPADRQRLLKSIPKLLGDLRQGLDNISFDQHRAASLFKELQICHIAALRGTRAEEVPLAEVNPEPDPEARTQAAPEVEHDDDGQPAVAEADEHQVLARSLEPGTWLEWHDSEDRALRGKLSWRSQLTGNCVFVDRRGMKVAEMSASDLAALFRAGRARRLEHVETPLLDRALDAMLDVLRRTDPEARPH